MSRAAERPPDKKQLRRELIARRDAFSHDDLAHAAARLTARLVALPEYARAASVLATMSIGSEWSTRAFLDRARADGKTVVLPRITPPPRHLEIHAVDDMARDLVPGVWDIPEPDPQRCRKLEFSDVDFALVPALAVDREGFRLGYGAGYFDRLLAGRGKRPFCVTALPAAFIVPQLPREPHDVPVDRVLGDAP
jgi:5-formyltetrahydrofolate cyclo-ligase